MHIHYKIIFDVLHKSSKQIQRSKTLRKGVKPQSKVRAGFYTVRYVYYISTFEVGTKFRVTLHKCLIFIRPKMLLNRDALSADGTGPGIKYLIPRSLT